ncbi:MAG TPA: DNA polymerase/3'-5' exonuclease PolX [Thermodesulfobacteriota bacterium]|nr:DNA polymerase/3'-5' exonuclease PolX [Deltaproteobacteria bacterium]HNR11791.1 DNA polymerase/3'-5' exonuclease PolX [Thermodesulfobacteriota bacterium]HNU71117.1 DNA polymerase/3'-5' exonuclease PolX [Thermodesulfobacteriota bacterium]HQO77491.1 DNA polymerase/3'-5' exonuclease PolX [Thermodesulfobacteriota bacterium]
MKNQDVARIFKRLAEMLEIKGENPFRIRAYQRAAQTIEELAEDIAAVAERQELEQLPGIGKDLARKIDEILRSGTLRAYEELKKEVPEALLDLVSISGVGPRLAKTLFENLHITTVDALEQLARDHKLRGMPGIQAKTEEKILNGIRLYRQKHSRLLLSTMLTLGRAVTMELQKLKEVDRIAIAGSLRRKKETIRDIDILVVSANPAPVMDFFTRLPFVGEVQAKGMMKSSVRTSQGIQIDLRVVEPESFGAALCYFTGSKAHNIRIREAAVKRALKINEYGVFRGGERIGGAEERDVYDALGLSFIEPELREDRGEIEAAQEGTLPILVNAKDLRGDLHVHSEWSDGSSTLKEIAEKAASLGLEWVAVCDHSPSLKIAGGLSADALSRKIAQVASFNRKGHPVTLLCGAEVDIGTDGSLDYPDELLSQLDLVVASVHSGFKQDETTITNRIVKAMRHSCVHIIGHPTGRLIGKRDPYAVNIEAIIEAAAASETVLEINGYPERLDLNDTACRLAKEKGALLGIGTDAHTAEHMDYLELGLAVARRGWLEKDDVLNCLSKDELKKKLARKQARSRERT